MKAGLILSCEHGGNIVPTAWRYLFAGAEDKLNSHRGWDIGALEMTSAFSSATGASVYVNTITRLLIDLNRGRASHNRFSDYSRSLSWRKRRAVEDEYYTPFRSSVTARIDDMLASGFQPVIHLSIHSFTPVLDGEHRDTEIGILYDPHRGREKELARHFESAILHENPTLIVHHNKPYTGTSDGHTTSLRGMYPDDDYIGIELEINQRIPLSGGEDWNELKSLLPTAFTRAVHNL